MSAFKQSMRKLALRAGLLAGASAAVLAVSGVSAASALAAPECPSNTVTAIEGKGASLQRVAQEKWTGRFVPSVDLSKDEVPAIPHEAKSGGYAATCGETPSVSYSSTGSGGGLKAFRFTGAGNIENGTHVGETHTISYAASDDAPTTAQIENAEAATEGGKATGANPLIIPVAETSIAVVANLPSGCEIQAGKGITWTELNRIFAGTLKKWNELTWDNGNAACEGEMTRVVRSDGSGTTYQFKNYLSVLQTEKSAVGPGEVKNEAGECVTKTWAQLRVIENATTGTLNTTWPESTCNTGVTTVVKKNGGGGVAEYVAANVGTIGYAPLPDAKGKGAAVVRLQNQGTLVTFAAPETGTSSNCGERVYTVPAAARTSGSGEGVDWSNVFGAKPGVGGSLYPLCALTYDLAWNSYTKAGYTSVADRVADVKAYIGYVIGEGQESAGYLESYYQPLPEGASEEQDVLMAAEYAASKIG